MPAFLELDIGQFAKILVVLGEAAFTLAKRMGVLDKLDRPEPLDHFETKLILDTQSQRRSVQIVERLIIHLVSQQGLRVHSVLNREVVVILNSRDSFMERDTLAK